MIEKVVGGAPFAQRLVQITLGLPRIVLFFRVPEQ